MQQRVAIARALAYQPSILLMDEPFASVDAQTRGDLEDLVLRVRDEFGITILFVTHDIDESVYLSDRIVVLTHSPTEVKEVIPVGLPAAARPDRDEGAARVRAVARARVPADQARAGAEQPPRSLSRYPERTFEKSIKAVRIAAPTPLRVRRTRDESDEDAPDACPGGRRGGRRLAHGGRAGQQRPQARAGDDHPRRDCRSRTASRSTSGSPRASSRSTGSRSRRLFSKAATTSCWRWPTTRATSATSAGCRRSSPARSGIPVVTVSASDVEATSIADNWQNVLVKGDGPIKTPKDLEGKTIAGNALKGVCEIVIRAALSKLGVDNSKVKFVAIPFPAMRAALNAGQVDAICAPEPFMTQGLTLDGDRIIVAPGPTLGKYWPNGTYVALQDWVAKNPGLAKGFHDAMAESLAYAQAHPEAVRALLPAAIRNIRLPVWSSLIDRRQLVELAKYAKEFGAITTLPNIAALVPASIATGLTLQGTVSGRAISMKLDGKPFKSLNAGSYTFVVSDQSARQNFHLKGPGLNKTHRDAAGGPAELHDEAREGRLHLRERREPVAEGILPGQLSSRPCGRAGRKGLRAHCGPPIYRNALLLCGSWRPARARRPARASPSLSSAGWRSSRRSSRRRPSSGSASSRACSGSRRSTSHRYVATLARARLPPAEPAVAQVPPRPAGARPRLLGDQLDGAAADRGHPSPAALATRPATRSTWRSSTAPTSSTSSAAGARSRASARSTSTSMSARGCRPTARRWGRCCSPACPSGARGGARPGAVPAARAEHADRAEGSRRRAGRRA